MSKTFSRSSVSISQHNAIAHFGGCFLKLFEEHLDREIFLFFRAVVGDDLAAAHHDETIAVTDGVAHVVRNHEGCEFLLADDVICRREDFVGRLGIEGRRRFVEEEDVRFLQSRHEERDGLALTAGEEADAGLEAIFQAKVEAF